MFVLKKIIIQIMLVGLSCYSLITCNAIQELDQKKVSLDFDELNHSTQPHKRFLALAPSHCEWVYEFKAEDLLFGRSEHCDQPNQVLNIPSVGHLFPPKLEQILKLEPSDVLMIEGHIELKKKLEQLGINVYQIQAKSLNDILEQSQKIGQLLGHQKEAKTWLKSAQAKLKQIKKRRIQRRVMIEIWFSPLTIAGASSYMGDLLKQAGGETLKTSRDWPTVSLEEVIHYNPEVLFMSTPALYKQLISATPPQAWQGIDAVKNGRVYLLEGRLARPGPRIIDELLWLQQMLNK